MPDGQDNVVQLDMFRNAKGVNKTERKMKAGGKPSRADALQALMETRAILNDAMESVKELAKTVSNAMANLHVLSNLLLDKNIFTQQELETKFQELIIKPMEELRKQKQSVGNAIANAKTISATEGYFNAVIEIVSKTDFQDGNPRGIFLTGPQIRDAFISDLRNPDRRLETLDEVRKLIPGIPAFTPLPTEPSGLAPAAPLEEPK
jgi:hypothetical protein